MPTYAKICQGDPNRKLITLLKTEPSKPIFHEHLLTHNERVLSENSAIDVIVWQ